MSPAHALCPACRSRVLPDWAECKFCGEDLRQTVPSRGEVDERADADETTPAPGEAAPGPRYDPLPDIPGLAPLPGGGASTYNPLPEIPGLPPPPPPFEPFGALAGSSTTDQPGDAPPPPPPPVDLASFGAAPASDWDAPTAPPPVSTWMPPGSGATVHGELPPGPLPPPPVGATSLPEVWTGDEPGEVAPPAPPAAPLPPPPAEAVGASSYVAAPYDAPVSGDDSWANAASWVAPEAQSEADAAAAASAGYVWDNPAFTDVPPPIGGDDDGAFAFADAQSTADPYAPDDPAAPAAPPPPGAPYDPNAFDPSALFDPATPSGAGPSAPGHEASAPPASGGASLFGGAAQRAGRPAPPPPADTGFGAPADTGYGTSQVSGPDTAFDPGRGSTTGARHDAPPPPGDHWDNAWEASPWSGSGPGPTTLTTSPAASPAASPLAPPKAESKVSREVRLLAMGIVLVLAVTAAFYYYRRNQTTSPGVWDPRVAPVAAFVASDRRMPFRNPVAVHFVSPSAYAHEVAADQPGSAADQARAVADEIAGLRALGLVSGSPDAGAVASVLAGPTPSAFYSFKRGGIYIRGTQITVGTRVALVGAMTQVLHAQWFGYRGREVAHLGAQPLAAVAEGDAAAVQDDYLAKLPATDRASYRSEQAAARASVPGADLPEALGTLAAAPVLFGKRWVAVVKAVSTVAGVNDAFRVPPSSDQQVYDPFSYLAATRPLQVDPPPLPPRSTSVAQGELGSTLLYLTLADRIGSFEALRAADGWAGDGYTSYRRHDSTLCIDSNIRGANDAGVAAIQVALADWARDLPDGQATVRISGLEVVLRACDPGPSATFAVPRRTDAVIAVPLVRTDIASGIYVTGARTPNGPNGVVYSPAEARCIGETVVHELTLQEIAAHPAESAKVKRLVAAAIPTCKSDVHSDSGSDTSR